MQTNLIPRYAFLISGVGRHEDRLQAFDRALLDAGPLAHNLVAVSSIIPAKCTLVTPEEGFKMLTAGQITFCVMARQDSNETGTSASAAVGLIKSKDTESFGYFYEYHGNAPSKKAADEIAQKLALEMFAVKTGTSPEKLELDFTKTISASIQQSGKTGEWVSAVALCIFIL